jgi:hypothetical protein
MANEAADAVLKELAIQYKQVKAADVAVKN